MPMPKTPATAVPQPSLFDDAPAPVKPPRHRAVTPSIPDGDLMALAQQLSPHIHLGTSSWSFPGWQGLVWADEHSEAQLSREGLGAYAAHPLLRSVSIDRSFYRPMTAEQYAVYAAQVPEDFRFVVKAPALVTDSVLRGEGGRGIESNPAFLDPQRAVAEFVQPALQGLGPKIGALVFELSPLPAARKRDMLALLDRLEQMLAALPALAPTAPDGVIAVEVRDPEWLTPDLRDVLRAHGARYCLGLHPRLPPIQEQLPLLRALWPGPLVCRWSLNRLHGVHGYESAKEGYAPFNRLVDPDPETRQTLARVIRATAEAGHPVYVTINNKAEGSAPLSVLELAQDIAGGTA
ncbi:MAG: DUF72 domain-containing protein [Leptothrix sp. (in: b-proteobacteria)]